MSMTREQIERRLTQRLEKKHREEVTWSTLTSAISGLTGVQRATLLREIMSAQDVKVGSFLRKIIMAEVRLNAEAEAVNILADDNISLAEIERLL